MGLSGISLSLCCKVFKRYNQIKFTIVLFGKNDYSVIKQTISYQRKRPTLNRFVSFFIWVFSLCNRSTSYTRALFELWLTWPCLVFLRKTKVKHITHVVHTGISTTNFLTKKVFFVEASGSRHLSADFTVSFPSLNVCFNFLLQTCI